MLPLPTPGPNATPAERDVHRLWTLVNEILEQLERQKSVAEKLRAEVVGMKNQAGRVAEGGLGLKRCHVDLSKEHLTSEMERFSAALVMENQTLLHEHKQLRVLLREYEGTLETVMGKFRGVCYAAPTHQHTLTRHYETLLMQEQVRMEQMQRGEPRVEAMLASLAALVRAAIMSLEGKDPAEGGSGGSPEGQEEEEEEEEEEEGQAREGQALEPLDDWANTRELEIARLQEENALLRKGLYISPEYDDTYGFKGGNWGVVGAGAGWNRGGGGVYATGYSGGYSSSPGGWYGEYYRGGVVAGFAGGGGHIRRGSGGGGRGGGVGRGTGPGPGAGMGMMGMGMGGMRRPGLTTTPNQSQAPAPAQQAQTRSVGLFGGMMMRAGSPPLPPSLQEQEVELEVEGGEGDGERRWREGRGLS